MTKQEILNQLLGSFDSPAFSIVTQSRLPPRNGAFITQLALQTDSGKSVRAYLSMPEITHTPCPAVLYIHAHGNRHEIGADELIMGRPALQSPPYAEAFAQAGMAALCIDLPCFGTRAHELESACAKQYLWYGQTLFGAMLSELQGAISLMLSMDGINSSRVGVFGISMGATLAFWLGALDSRLRAVAHLCCFADLATLVGTGAHDLHGNYMTVPGLLSRFHTGEIAGLVAPRPQLACMGLLDPLTPPLAVERGLSDLRAAYEKQDAASALHILVDPQTGHSETQEMRHAVIDFFTRELC